MNKSYKEFAAEIRKIREHFLTHKDNVKTEQHTKTAFIQPLIVALGYQLENPNEVVPEPVADLKAKKGEKVDYVIKWSGNPILTIECKHWEDPLNRHRAQLYRYYHNIRAKFGLLTNGKDYEFFADHEKLNIMDEEPFLKFDITTIKDYQVEFLWKFSKSEFNLDKNINSSIEMRQLKTINENINGLFPNPSDDLVKSLTKGVYMNQKVKVTSGILDQFRPLVKKAIDGYIDHQAEAKANIRIAEERLKIEAAFKAQYPQPESADPNADSSSKVETTEEELEGFYIVKSIIRQVVTAKRISYKASQSYLSIILDETSHKTVCRLRFEKKKKYLITFDASKTETKNEISDPDDIFKYADYLIETAKRFGQGTK